MRAFELAMICLLAASVGCCRLSRAPRTLLFLLAGLTYLVLMLHLALEGAHWQMFPAYLAVLLLPLLGKSSKFNGIFIPLLAGASCAAAAALPIFKLPPPTGPYAIGTRMLYLEDQTRSNAPAPQDNGPGRNIVVQLWYPAAWSHNRFAPYRQFAENTLRASYMSVVPTHARLDAPLASAAAPWHVLLFNPAWGERRGQSTALVEDLASHGYVVAAIEHPGRTGPILLPDGRVLPVAADPDVDDLAHSTAERVESAIAAEVTKEAADDSFVLDQLSLLNAAAQSPFHGKLDTNHSGALGHSLGGAVAADACALDPRLRAAFSMSAPFFGKVRQTGLQKPYLNIGEVISLATPDQLAHLDRASRIDAETDLLDTANHERLLHEFGGWDVILRGIHHSSFTDKAFYSPIRKLGDAGTTPRERVQAILRQYAVQFFNKALKGRGSQLLDNPGNPFPEVTQRYFPGTAAHP